MNYGFDETQIAQIILSIIGYGVTTGVFAGILLRAFKNYLP